MSCRRSPAEADGRCLFSPQGLGGDCDDRDRVGGPGVGVAVVAGVEEPDPGGELGWRLDDLLVVFEQPLGSGRPTPLAPSTAQTRFGHAFP